MDHSRDEQMDSTRTVQYIEVGGEIDAIEMGVLPEERCWATSCRHVAFNLSWASSQQNS